MPALRVQIPQVEEEIRKDEASLEEIRRDDAKMAALLDKKKRGLAYMKMHEAFGSPNLAGPSGTTDQSITLSMPHVEIFLHVITCFLARNYIYIKNIWFTCKTCKI